jgi:hypothetical protein
VDHLPTTFHQEADMPGTSPRQDVDVYGLLFEKWPAVDTSSETARNHMEETSAVVRQFCLVHRKLTSFRMHSSAKNTVHIDDLVIFNLLLLLLLTCRPDDQQGRNFALNPTEGLKIRAFKDCHTDVGMSDRELDKLSRYLCHIATQPDFRGLKHKLWEDTVRRLPPST